MGRDCHWRVAVGLRAPSAGPAVPRDITAQAALLSGIDLQQASRRKRLQPPLTQSELAPVAAVVSWQKRPTDIPLRSCSAIRARQYSIRASALFPKAALVMTPICGLQGGPRKKGSSGAYELPG